MIKAGGTFQTAVLTVAAIIFTWASCSWAGSPSTFVNDPRHMVFTDLQKISSFLYDDLIYEKDVVSFVGRPPFDVIGKSIVKAKFAKIGIPDPVESKVEYSIVVKEDKTRHTKINGLIVLRGGIDAEKLLKYSRDRYRKYMKSLVDRKMTDAPKLERDEVIGGCRAVAFPFAERASEAVFAWFPDHVVVAVVPAGDYSLIQETLGVLKGSIPSEPQPDVINYKVQFGITAKERRQILGFESGLDKMKANARKNFKTLLQKVGVDTGDGLDTPEDRVRKMLTSIDNVMYQINCKKEGDNYVYGLLFVAKCESEEHAEAMKEVFTEQFVKASSSCLTDADRDAYEDMKIFNKKNFFMIHASVPADQVQQYQFVSMALTLMFQDRRFTKWFHL